MAAPEAEGLQEFELGDELWEEPHLARPQAELSQVSKIGEGVRDVVQLVTVDDQVFKFGEGRKVGYSRGCEPGTGRQAEGSEGIGEARERG